MTTTTALARPPLTAPSSRPPKETRCAGIARCSTDRTTTMRPSRLTAAVHRLVALDLHHRPSIVRLTAAQVSVLTQVARTPQAFEERVSAPLAIEALARGAKAAAAIPVLARIVGEQSASIPARIT